MTVKKMGVIFLGLAVVLAASCRSDAAPPPASPTATKTANKPAWQEPWDQSVAGAAKEGKVFIYTTIGPDVRQVLSKVFKEKYKADIEWVAGLGQELSQKILAEKRAGISVGDVYIGGPTTVLTVLRPAGAMASVKPLLLLPEVTDPTLYFGGKLPFVDNAGTTLFGFGLTVSNTMAVNTEMVKPGEIKGYTDLLDPKWKDKIVIFDPTIPNTGAEWFLVTAYYNLNPDFHRQIVKQNPIITRDTRQQMEWVARGKYAIAIGGNKERVAEFQRVGAPISWIVPKEGLYLANASGTLSILDKAPHPNATKVFVNWLLSKEGITLWSKIAQMQSAREDIPTDFLPEPSVRKKGVTYLNLAKEDIQNKFEDSRNLAVQIYGPLLK